MVHWSGFSQIHDISISRISLNSFPDFSLIFLISPRISSLLTYATHLSAIGTFDSVHSTPLRTHLFSHAPGICASQHIRFPQPHVHPVAMHPELSGCIHPLLPIMRFFVPTSLSFPRVLQTMLLCQRSRPFLNQQRLRPLLSGRYSHSLCVHFQTPLLRTILATSIIAGRISRCAMQLTPFHLTGCILRTLYRLLSDTHRTRRQTYEFSIQCSAFSIPQLTCGVKQSLSLHLVISPPAIAPAAGCLPVPALMVLPAADTVQAPASRQ